MISDNVYNLLPNELKQMTTIGSLPSNINNCIALIEDGGRTSTYFNNNTIGQPVLKIVVQHSDFVAGRNIVDLCRKMFKTYHNADFDMILINEPLYFGRDSNHHNMWQLTFKIINKGE